MPINGLRRPRRAGAARGCDVGRHRDDLFEIEPARRSLGRDRLEVAHAPARIALAQARVDDALLGAVWAPPSR